MSEPSPRFRRGAAGCALALAATSVVSCSSSAAHRSGPDSASADQTVATRWWSNSAVQTGSKISKTRPDSAVTKLHPSRKDYCGMLEQTVAAGKALLPHGAASDPAVIDSLSAFIGELQKVAPAEVAADWQVLGKAMLALVKAGGKAPKTPVVDGATVNTAATSVAADAKQICRIDLSSVTG
jgi:hypothetical protein